MNWKYFSPSKTKTRGHIYCAFNIEMQYLNIVKPVMATIINLLGHSIFVPYCKNFKLLWLGHNCYGWDKPLCCAPERKCMQKRFSFKARVSEWVLRYLSIHVNFRFKHCVKINWVRKVSVMVGTALTMV